MFGEARKFKDPPFFRKEAAISSDLTSITGRFVPRMGGVSRDYMTLDFKS